MNFAFHALTGFMGALFRRWWGGWHVPAHIVKVVVGYALAFLFALFFFKTLLVAGVVAAIIGTAFMNPLHSWGQGMGFADPTKATWKCVAVMGGSYGAFTASAAGAVWYLTGQIHPFMALGGFFIPIPYLLAWLTYKDFGYETHPQDFRFLKIGGEWFIDSPTAIGECFLGALLLGGI